MQRLYQPLLVNRRPSRGQNN